MTSPMDDDTLLSLLGDSLADDRPSDDATEAAYAAFGWRTLDAELARLIDDHHVEVMAFSQTTAFSRVVTYETGHGSIEVAIGDDTVELVARPAPVGVTLRRPDDRLALAVDDGGRASASGLSGPIRFEVTWSGGTTLTPWLTL
ncbi:MAG: hypothetical protein ACFCVK_08720 [Acidimicrobiales bacterium]